MSDQVIGEQTPLYLSGTRLDGTWYWYYPETGVDNRITEFSYTDNRPGEKYQYALSIGGGSGNGALHYSVQNVTGSGTIDSQGRFTFLTPGTVWVKVYKDGSSFTQYPDTEELVNGYYEQSKTLVIALTLDTTQVKITVTADKTLNIGESVPSISSLQNEYEVTYPNKDSFPSALATLPQIYFVYDSDDFYKFDVMCEANSEDGYSNGVKYRKNPDGTWKLEGTSTDLSIYNLIVSTTELPSYLVKGRRYKLIKNSGVGTLVISWYKESGDIVNVTQTASTHSTVITVPNDTVGVWIKLQVSSNVVTDVDLELHLYDLDERKMDNLHEGEYPIAARYASVNDTTKYTKKIQYRSSKLKFVNTQYYRIYTDYDEDLGDVEVNYRRAKPYTEVIFTVKAKPGAMYTTGTGSSETPNITINGVTYETLGLPERDNQNRMIQSSYSFTMPISNVTISVNFINITDSEIPYGEYPYTDAGYGSGFEISFEGPNNEGKLYADALVFCKYARYVYFNEVSQADVPLMTGTVPGLFYESAPEGETQTEENLYLRRRDMISVLRRISHGTFGFPKEYFPKPESEYGDTYNAANVAHHPDEWFYAHSRCINTPEARLYTYAGYPTKDGEDIQSTDAYAEFSDTSLENYATAGSGANDDYLANYDRIQDISWNTWIGATSGYNDKSYAPRSSATFQEAASVLWRYAKFRQFDIMGHGSDYTDVDDSGAAYWAQNGPLKWAISRGILPKRRMTYRINGVLATTSGQPIHPDAFINRAEYAYMIMKFCQLYAW